MKSWVIFWSVLLFWMFSGAGTASAEIRYATAEGPLKVDKNRKNIAKTLVEDFEFGNPDDFVYLPKGMDDYQGQRVGWFVPATKLIIHSVTVEVEGVDLERGDFFLGDNCLYTNADPVHAVQALPFPGEIHCTGTSVWNASGYERTLSYGDTKGFILQAGMGLSCPIDVALIHPEEIKDEEVKDATGKCTIEYSVASSQNEQYKAIRIPYLDQYPDAPVLIDPKSKWYKNWYDGTPLKVAGFSLYYNPKPFRDQILKDLCVFAVDQDSTPVTGKEICMEDQVYIAGQTHLQYEPAFFEGSFELGRDEYLAASCTLYKGNFAGDCVMYVLIEIPAHLRDEVNSSPTYLSSGIANRDYLDGEYCDHHIFNTRLTPFGKRVIRAMGETTLDPWASIAHAQEGKVEDGLNSQYCRAIFAD